MTTEINNKNAVLCVMIDNSIDRLGGGGSEKFEEFFKELVEVDVKFEAEVTSTSGRNDILFYVAGKDVPRFAMERLRLTNAGLPIRWYEDVISPVNNSIDENEYDTEILEKYKN